MDAQDLKYLDKNQCNGLNQLKTLNEKEQKSFFLLVVKLLALEN